MTGRMKAFKKKCQENREIFEKEEEKVTVTPEIKLEMSEKCLKFMDELADILKEDYEQIRSCNKDISWYLVPKGTEKDISYYGKPVMSFRVSDHWSWYSSIKKCSDPDYIQCENVDLPRAHKRKSEGIPTRPIMACQVAIQLGDGKYHCVFGEKLNRRGRQIDWEWEKNDPMDACRKFGLI